MPGGKGSGGTGKGMGGGGGVKDVPMTLDGAYATAKNIETALSRRFVAMRARQLAAAVGASPDAVEGMAKTAEPQRPDLALPEGGGKLLAERRAVSEALAMAARAQRLLDQAQASAGTEASVFAMQAEAAAAQQNADAKDLTGREAGQEAGKGIGGGGGQDVIPMTSFQNRAARKGDPTASTRQGVVPTIGMMDIDRAVPGTVLGASGARGGDWMEVDSWYWLGPFPNPERKNLHTAFGPEQGVDLDAEYVGLNGRRLRWQFRQSIPGMVLPPQPEEYAVYYGYTEVTSDRDRDVWIAVAADDTSLLYLNNQIVWISQDILKGWNPGEGLRRVHLNKGTNRLLFRLENGWLLVGMSVAISLRDHPDVAQLKK